MKFRQNRRLAASAAGAIAVGALIAAPAAAEFDQALMMKWASVTVVHFEVAGDFAGDVSVVQAATNGIAHITDHVDISFDYDQTTAQLVGTPVIRNQKSVVSALRNGADGCAPPTLEGAYEQATVDSIATGYSGQPELIVTTDYPAAQMPFNCTSAFQAVKARKKTDHVDFVVPGVMILAMGDEADSAEIKVAKDRKSFTVTRGGWTYVYTPTPAADR
jgi:hypothetical protein